MKFEQKFIYLRNAYQDKELGKDILPGFIVGRYMNRYHIIGMNTSTIIAIKNNEEQNNNNENNNENNNNDNNNNENNNNENKNENDKNINKECNGKEEIQRFPY